MKNQNIKFAAVNLPQILRSPRWLAMMFLLPLLMMMIHFAMAAPTVEPAPVVSAGEKFDHVKTGFNLTGAHATARCTSCHINNVFKGAPRDCATCHRAANLMAATSKPSNHINTNAQCDTCHKTTVWTPAIFSHVGMPDGQCAVCHNGTTALGKSRNHIPVPATISCDNCHKTSSWLQYAFSHKNINSGCSDCHGGQVFTGVPVQPKAKPNNHMLTSLDCGACHSTTNFVILKSGAPVTLPSGHFLTSQPCSVCHSGGSFLPGRMNHAGITGGCAACHNGTAFLGVTPRSQASANPAHMTTTAPCETCHTSTSTFLVANLTTAPAGHIPTNQACITCHSGGYGPNAGVMNHTGILSGCATCHNGQIFSLGNTQPVSKPTTPLAHIPTSAACELCHAPTKTTVGGFAGTAMNHSGITASCAACHNDGMSFAGVIPTRKQDAVVTHMTTTADCSTCHKSTTTFKGATGVPLPSGHFPTTQPCSTCHASGYGANSGVMNHVGITGGCTTCHSGTAYLGVTPLSKNSVTGHVPTPLDCGSCHLSTVTFKGAAAPLPANHIPTSQTCTTCHVTYGANSGVMNHVGITSSCATCHNGQTFAVGMNPVSKANFPPHVSTALDCSSCHSTSNFTSFAGATGGTLPLNHLPTVQPCSTCHTSFGSGSGNMNHVGIVSGCTSCHNNQIFAVGMKPTSKPANHVPTSTACETCHATNVFTNFAGTKMNHAGISSGCASCHGAGMSFIGGIVTYPSNHVPTSGVTNGALCETCHSKTNFATFSGTAMVHTGLAVGSCDSCHSNTPYAGVTPLYVPSNHIPYKTSLLNGNTMKCDFCHKLTTVGGFKTLSVSSTTMHNGSQGNSLASGICVTCHLSSANYLGVLGKKSHNGASAAKDCSSSGCHRPLGNEGTAYTSW